MTIRIAWPLRVVTFARIARNVAAQVAARHAGLIAMRRCVCRRKRDLIPPFVRLR
ncbi:hypothetical protein BSIN_1821 [Burkholderia singularis]|uniref:Uncharacterized protein n=1 Tax=Burkholderia singularis TaxID=1503053 RepID=A0A238H027_9BURK|nr:hypothetical protein BSIN_1821 [Burkholderia singularis]